MEVAAYAVKTPVFEGPLDLLLSLIEKRKLFINDISLAKVTDDFITHIKAQSAFPMGESAHFILIASTLLLIKSKSLLPNLDLSGEEEASIDDLQKRLQIYQKYKEASKLLQERFGSNILFSKLPSRNTAPVFSPHKSMSIASLFAAVKEAIQNIPKPEKLAKAIVKQVVSLEEMIDRLTDRVKKSIKMSFKSFAGHGKADKVEVIVSFLAMLELVKQGIIAVNQDKHFEDIHMETQNVSVPTYT